MPDIRIQKLKRVIPVLYHSDLDSLKKAKLKLTENACISENNAQSEEEYALIVKDLLTNTESINPLKGTDALLAYFQTPISINDLLEELNLQNIQTDESALKRLQFKILDIITEKIIIDGLLEFDEN